MAAGHNSMMIRVRKAENTDIGAILRMLGQVNLIHHNGRPDLFNKGTKYTAEQIEQMLTDSTRPIFVAEENGEVCGYAFCIFQSHYGDPMLAPITTLYIDDLCVDEKHRRNNIGKTLYEAVVKLAKRRGCYNITLNAWTLNPEAIMFYSSLGMTPLKICMEHVIESK